MSGAARVFRMVMPGHTCPYGIKALDLLRRRGFEVEDHWLRTREETDTFKAEHGVKTTPQVFIGGERIGGYDDLRAYFGLGKPTLLRRYLPVIVLFALAGLMALAAGHAVGAAVSASQLLTWFVSFSMCLLALLKLQDIESFSTMFVNYDLLARRWVRYAYLYPWLEGGAGLLMAAGLLPWISAPVALLIGLVGAASVIKAVYVDKRELKCACVGGASKVPLGIVSLLENLMMVGMALAMVMDR